MKKLAAVIAFGLGFVMILPAPAVDSHENSTSAASGQSTGASDTNSGAKSSNESEGKKNKHNKKAHNHKKKGLDADGDGEPMGELGKRKHVDGGFDFDNSKKFHRMGNDQ